MAESLAFPASEADIRALRVGDAVLLNGVIVTARDAAHRFMMDHADSEVPARKWMKNGCIYHCGPVMRREGREWVAVAAGPTTSMREEPCQAEIIERFTLRAVVGKGGMGEKTRQACQRAGCVYLHAIGGLAATLAACIKKTRGVYLYDELGPPEAFWVLEVEDFPAVVTIDAQGDSLHEAIRTASEEELRKVMAR